MAKGVVIFHPHKATTLSYGIALAWMTGLFVSPEAFLLQGRLTGLTGFGCHLILAIAIALHWLNATTLHESGNGDSAIACEIELLTDAYGPFAAALLLLAARSALTLCLATAVLVTAGFVFNEIYLYWFPNFGFAALLLAIILALNLAGPRTAAAAQVLFTLTALAGLAGVALLGLLRWDQAAIPTSAALTFPAASRGIGLAAIAFVGYDMLGYTDRRLEPIRLTRVMKIGLVAGGCVFILWNAVSLIHVAPQRLVNTGIPHILVARAILGDAGRIVIGMVVIAGACAAVNFLFQTVARMMVVMARQRLLPVVFEWSPSRPVLALLMLAGSTGMLMGAGFAGSQWLDIGIRASLLLWLLLYALRHAAVFLLRRNHRGADGPQTTAGPRLRHVLLAAALTAMAVLLLSVDEAPPALLKSLCVILLSAAAFAGAGLLLARVVFFKPPAVSTNQKKGE